MGKQYFLRQAEDYYKCEYERYLVENDHTEDARYNLKYVKTLLNAIRKQIPTSAKNAKTCVGNCPRCGMQIILLPYDRYCSRCGQKIKGHRNDIR